MVDLVAITALALDAAIGWPAAVYARIGHPVGAFAHMLNLAERWWNRPAAPEGRRRVLGVAALAIVAGGTFALAWTLQTMLVRYLGGYAWIALALCAAPGLAQRSLYDHVKPIAAALAIGDIVGARAAVGMIVGRDAARLDSQGIARAGIESLAESFCDGVVAPLFWLIVLGLPGLWTYKAINTADSLIGHREARWLAFGWASARVDDLANWIPARLSGGTLCLAGAGGFRVMWRDARKHASPNAGWPEAAIAGVLGIRLAGPVVYDGIAHIKPWIGDGRRAVTHEDLTRALQVYARACLILWVIAGALAWVR